MNVNKVFVCGNLTREVEIRKTASGTDVARFGVAVNHRYTDRDGNKAEKTHFVDCVAWGRVAETIARYLDKGDPIFVEGRLEYSSWQDKSTGQNRSKLEVTVEHFQFVGGRKEKSTDVPF